MYGCVQVNAWLDAKHKVYAFTYVMTEAARKEREGKEYPRAYRLICSAGAHWHGVKNEFRRRDDPPFGFQIGSGYNWLTPPRNPKAKCDEGVPAIYRIGGGYAKK